METYFLKFVFRDNQFFAVGVDKLTLERIMASMGYGPKMIQDPNGLWAINTENLLFVHTVDPTHMQELLKQPLPTKPSDSSPLYPGPKAFISGN